MTAIFWCSVALIAYTYLGYPLIAWLRSCVSPEPWRRANIEPGVSIVVAVHNGLNLVREQLLRLLEVDYPAEKTEIICVSDGSTDGTAEFLSSFHHHRVRTHILTEHSGKAVALNQGIASANHEIIVFIDARPTVEPNAIRELVKNFSDAKVGCAAGELIVQAGGENTNTSAVGGLYWRYEQWIRKCEAIVDSPLGVYGGFYAARRELVTQFPPGTILDDMYQPLAIVSRGYRSVIDSNARVWDRWPDKAKGEFQRKVRTLAGNFQLVRLAPWLLSGRNRLRFNLVSHKLLRLVMPYAFLAMLVSSFALRSSIFFATAAGLQLILYLFALIGVSGRGGGRLRRLLAPASAFCLLNAAAVVGLYRYLFATGPLWKIWTVTAGGEHGREELTHAARV